MSGGISLQTVQQVLVGGMISLKSGASAGGKGGDIVLSVGDGNTQAGGDIIVDAGKSSTATVDIV